MTTGAPVTRLRQLSDALEPLRPTLGTTFYVDNGHASAADGSNPGTSPDAPCLTLDYAIGLCTASAGDVIIVGSRHAENLTAVDSIDCDKAGITILGLGHGNLIPTFSTTAAAGSITVDAANVTIKNIKLVANFATGTTAGVTITASGDGCTLDGLKFRDTSTANEFLVHVSVATTVTDLTIKNCSFVTLAGSMTNSILFAGTTSNTVIENNHFFVDSSDSVIDHLAAAATNIYLKGNFIVNIDTDLAGYVIDCHASSTGGAFYNGGAYAKVDAEMTKGAAMWWIENYFSNTVLESGLLEPATSHAIP